MAIVPHGFLHSLETLLSLEKRSDSNAKNSVPACGNNPKTSLDHNNLLAIEINMAEPHGWRSWSKQGRASNSARGPLSWTARRL